MIRYHELMFPRKRERQKKIYIFHSVLTLSSMF
uniref:Uncharacterized protein n=1 Tax=Arundo donax TaxID=35708 RepID=A0A0A9HIQ4_ARUDO